MSANPLSMTDAIDYILSHAKVKKLDVEVLATQRKGTAISFQKAKLDQFSFSETHQLGVRILDGNHEGVAYSESLLPENLDQILVEARENARMIEKDWVAKFHDSNRAPELPGLFNSQLEDVETQEKIAKAAQLEAAALEFDPAITSVAYTRYGDSSSTVHIANTLGLHASYKQNSCLGYTYCLAVDGSNTVMAGESVAERNFTKLNAREIGETAAAKTLARRGAVRPQTGKYTVVFENRAAEELWGLIGNYFSAKAIDENTSPLKGRLGERVFSTKVTITDDPFLLSAHSSRPFDEEGYASQKTTLVQDGVVASYLTNSVLAAKLGLPHSAHASRAPSTDLNVSATNLVVQPGNHSLAKLLDADHKVILVTSINGTAGFRATSGDFSIPMEGDLFENGKRSGPLKDFLISGNILQLFAGVEAVGNDTRAPVGSILSPSLLVRELNVIGQS